MDHYGGRTARRCCRAAGLSRHARCDTSYIVLLVALFTVHLPFGFSSIKFLAVTAQGPQFGKPGIECDLLYLACLATLVLGGSGPISLDRWRASARDCIAACHTQAK